MKTIYYKVKFSKEHPDLVGKILSYLPEGCLVIPLWRIK